MKSDSQYILELRHLQDRFPDVVGYIVGIASKENYEEEVIRDWIDDCNQFQGELTAGAAWEIAYEVLDDWDFDLDAE